MHEEDRRQIEEALPEFVAEKKGWSGLIVRWRHKDGSFRHLESNAVPILGEGGELVGFRGTDRDVTEREQARVALQEAKEAAESANRVKSGSWRRCRTRSARP